MPSIQLSTLFKYLSIGLVLFLLVSSSEALPTDPKKDTKSSKTPSKTGAKAGSGHGKTCPVPAPKSKLQKRTGVTHPSGKSATSLFHGTANHAGATAMATKVELAKTHNCGDLHKNSKGSEGGAYFTDSIIVAAQYACHRDEYMKQPTPATVYVLEFTWTPGTSKVYEFTSVKDLTDDKCKENDMITGPMHDPVTDIGLTPEFWQYALVKQAAVDSGLKYVKTHTIPCSVIPKATALTAAVYSEGQKGHSGFSTMVTALEAGTYCPA